MILLPSSALAPGWADAFALPFAWPLVVPYVGTVVVGNAFLGEPAVALQCVVVGVGVALSTVWMFVVSTWIVRAAVPGDSGVGTR